MSSIDNRIVQMQFENSQFEKGIKESLKSLDDLEKALEFKDAERGLAALQKAGDSFSLASMADGIEKIGEKFSVLGIIGKRVLEDLTDSAVRMGEQFVKSVTIDQISAGWDKYANKTQAVQTIIAATGKDIDFVNERLEKLAWFTDETSYNFVDMTSNIGKFTSMGIDLDTSVTAMEGIATWAAVSGAGINEASRAMYNMSQAIGVGSVKLMDWKSIENANMATKEFKQTVIDTAKAMGKLNAKGKTAKGTAVTYENFAQTLKEGWFTKDVLLETLKKYGEYADAVYTVASEKGITAAQAMELVSGESMELGEKAFKAAQEAKTFAEAINSVKDAVSTGWMNIFEKIFGNYEEAKVLWTDLANYLWDIFAAPLSNTVDLLDEWRELGGRTKALEGIYDIFAAIADIINTVKDAIGSVFPEMTAEKLYEYSEAIAEFGKQFKSTFGRYETEFKTVKKKEEEFGKLVDTINNGYGNERVAAIRAVQDELVRLGYLADGDFTRSVWGPTSQAALDKFQNAIKATDEMLNTTLKFGDRGDEVKEFQQKLKDLEFDPGAIDGIWGPKTQKAYERYIASLGESAKSYKELKKGMRDDDVKDLQMFLIREGKMDAGQADGVFGPKTEDAVKRWQKAHGLMVTGIVDKKTYDAMFPEKVKEAGEELEYETRQLVDYSDKMKNLLYITQGAAAALHILTSFFGFLGKVVGHIGTLLSPLIDAFIAIAAALGNSITAFDKWLQEAGVFDKWFEDVKKFLEPFGKWVQKAADGLLAFFGITKNAKDSNGEMMTFAKLWKNITDAVKKTGIIDKVTKAWENFKATIAKVKESLKGTSKAFKDNLGKRFKSILDGIPGAIASVIEWFGNLATKGLNLITPWIEKLPNGIQKIKDFWSALTQEGNPAKNQAPGFLIRVRDAFKSVIDFLFGEGDIANGKTPGVFRRLGRLIMGDMEGFTEGMDDNTKKKILGTIQDIKDFIQKVREGIVYLFGGELSDDKKISDETLEKIDNFKSGVESVIEGFRLLFTGEYTKEKLSLKTAVWILLFRQRVLAVINFITDTFNEIKESLSAIFTNGIDLSSLEGFKKSIEDAWNNIITILTGTGEKAGGIAKKGAKIGFNILLLGVIGVIRLIIKTFKILKGLITGETDNETIKQIRSTIIDIFNAIRGFIEGIVSTITALITGETDNEKILQARGTVIGIFNSITGFVNDVIETVKVLISGDTDNETILNIRKTIVAVIKAIGSFVTDVFGMISSFVTGSTKDERVNEVREFLTGFFADVGTFFTNIFNTLKALITGDTDNETILAVRDTIIGIFNAIKDTIVSIYNTVKGLFTGEVTFDSVGGFFEQIWNSIKGFIETVAGIISEKIGVSTEELSTFFDNLWKNVKNFLKWAIIGVILLKVIRFIGNISGLFNRFEDGINAFKGGSQSLGKSILQMAIGIGIIAAAIFALSQLPEEKLKRGLDAITTVFGYVLGFLVVSGISAFLKLGPEIKNIGQAIRDVGIGIGIIAAALWLLSSDKISEADYKKGMIRLIQMLLAVVGLFFAIAVINKLSGRSIEVVLQGFWQVALLVGVMAVVTGLLGKMKEKTLKKGLLALVAIMGMIAGLFLAIGGAARIARGKTGGSLEATLKGLWQIAILVGVMALVVAGLGAMSEEDLGKGLLSLALVMVFIVLFAKAINDAIKNLNWKAGLVVFGGLSLVVIVLGAVLNSLRGIDWTVIAAFTGGLAVLVFALSKSLPALGAMPTTTALKACLNLVLVFAALGLAMNLFSALMGDSLTTFSGALWLLSGDLKDFSDAMGQLNEDNLNNYKTFMSAITGTFISLKLVNTDKITEFSTALMKIGAGISLFLLETSGLTSTTGDSFKSFADNIKAGCDVLSGLTGSSTVIKQALLDIGGAVNLFYGNLKNVSLDENGKIDTKVVQAAFDAIGTLSIDETTIANVAKYADDKGSGLNDFATGLTNLSTAIANYGEKIGGLNVLQVAVANLVLDNLSSISTSMNNISFFDAAVELIKGKKDYFGEFVLDVEALGTALESYGNSIGTLSLPKVLIANAVLATLSNLEIKSKSGFIAWITGSTSLDKFATNIKHIGDGLAAYAKSISGETFDKTKIENSLIPLTTIANALNTMKATGGLKGLLSGDVSLDKLSNSIATFGTKMAQFYQNLGDLKYTDLQDGFSIIEKAIELQGAYAVALDNTGMGTYHGGIGTVGADLYYFFSEISAIKDDGYYGKAVAIIQGAKDDLIGFFSGLSSITNFDPNVGLSNIDALMTGLANYASTITTEIIPSYNQTGIDLAQAISDGMAEAKIAGPDTIAGNAVKTLKTYISSFTALGKNFVAGLTVGVTLNTRFAVASAYNVGRQMVAAVARAFRSASPSKETMKLGNYFTEGLAIGTEDKIGQATNAASTVADSMLSTASGTLASLSELLADDIDVNPVISPVVDLTNARASAAMIGGLFGNQTFGVNSQAMALSAQASTFNGRPVTIQNGTINTSEAMANVNDKLNALNAALTTSDNKGPHVDPMETLGEKFGDLANAVTNLKIVLDSGVLVGEISGMMDEDLGALAARRERGN